MPELKKIRLTGLAAVPDGAQEHAVITVRKARKEGQKVDKDKLIAALKMNGATEEVAKAIAGAMNAEDEVAVAAALKSVIEGEGRRAIKQVGSLADGTPVYDNEPPTLVAMAKELTAARREKARDRYPLVGKFASDVLDAALDARPSHKDNEKGENPITKQLDLIEARVKAVVAPVGAFTGEVAKDFGITDGFENEGGGAGDFRTDYDAAVAKYAKDNGVDDMAVARERFSNTAEAAQLRQKHFN